MLVQVYAPKQLVISLNCVTHDTINIYLLLQGYHGAEKFHAPHITAGGDLQLQFQSL